MNVTVDGKNLKVEMLNGTPWYVELILPSGFIRTIWHRANCKAPGPLAQKAISAI